jgi:hypothetical protein
MKNAIRFKYFVNIIKTFYNNFLKYKKKYMPTINAFTMKPSITQILAYVMILLGLLVFYTCITTNMLNTIANIIFSTLYGFSILMLIIFATLASYLDPTDPII